MGNLKSKRDPVTLSDKEIQLLLHKTDLSKEDILEWHKDFIEEHADGQINYDEFLRLYKGIINPNEEGEKFARALFTFFDTEKNDKLALSDFLILTPFEVRRQPAKEEKEGDENKENNEEAAEKKRQQEIDEVDEKTLELALDILNDRDEKIDKEELFKIPYLLCETAGQNAASIFETDEQFAKKKFFVFENDKLDRDEFLRLVRASKRFAL